MAHCPRCSGTDLWDDNMWWGCNSCGFAGSEEGPAMFAAREIPGLPRTIDEVRRRAGTVYPK